MLPKVKQFIEENIDLIEQNTKESWEEIYKKIPESLTGKLTETLLKCEIDPARILGYIPEYYLSWSNISDYKMPNNITNIGKYAFQYNRLKNVILSDNIKGIEYSTSKDDYKLFQNLDNYTIEDGVSYIPSNNNKYFACAEIDKNKEIININTNCKIILPKAFYQHSDSKVKEIFIPKSVYYIMPYAFTDDYMHDPPKIFIESPIGSINSWGAFNGLYRNSYNKNVFYDYKKLIEKSSKDVEYYLEGSTAYLINCMSTDDPYVVPKTFTTKKDGKTYEVKLHNKCFTNYKGNSIYIPYDIILSEGTFYNCTIQNLEYQGSEGGFISCVPFIGPHHVVWDMKHQFEKVKTSDKVLYDVGGYKYNYSVPNCFVH